MREIIAKALCEKGAGEGYWDAFPNDRQFYLDDADAILSAIQKEYVIIPRDKLDSHGTDWAIKHEKWNRDGNGDPHPGKLSEYLKGVL